MQKITSAAELKDAIQLLEAEQAEKRTIVKEQLNLAVETFRPANLIAVALNDIKKSPYLIENILGAATGLITGFYSNKLIFNPRGNKLKKLIGVILQFGVTNLVARNQETIKAIGQVLFKHLARRKRAPTVEL